LENEKPNPSLESTVVDDHSGRRDFLKRALVLGAASAAAVLASATQLPDVRGSSYTLGTADDEIDFGDPDNLWKFYSDGVYRGFIQDFAPGNCFVFGTTTPSGRDLELFQGNAGSILMVKTQGTYALFDSTDLRVQKSNAELRLMGLETNGRVWRLFSDGTSFNFRDETGGKNILIVATDALQIGRRMVPVGDAVPGMDLGIVGARWNSVRAANVFSGDYNFQNDFKLTEEGETGIALYNKKGVKIAVFDEDGNMHIKGDVIKDL